MKKVKDYYFHKAKKENFPARSVYKLEELDKKFNLIKKGFKVLDLGAFPGSWSKYCAIKIGNDGLVLGIDKEKITSFKSDNFKCIQADIFKLDSAEIEKISPEFDIVLSDMAPSTTGIKDVDQARSLDLVRQAFCIAKKFLRERGVFLFKIFQGQDVKGFIETLKPHFESVKTSKPESSRKESFETYIVCERFKR